MYEPSRMYKSFYVAGFQYYEGPLVLEKIKVGTKLRLVAEPDNPYDPCAIAIYYKKTMIGHVPREDNGLLSLLDYYGHSDVFKARVLQVNPEAETWKQLKVGVYVRDAR